jgi:hypothetical protein
MQAPFVQYYDWHTERKRFSSAGAPSQMTSNLGTLLPINLTCFWSAKVQEVLAYSVPKLGCGRHRMFFVLRDFIYSQTSKRFRLL